MTRSFFIYSSPFPLSFQNSVFGTAFWHFLFLPCILSLSHVWLFATPWTVAYQAPLSMGSFQARELEWGAIPFSRGLFPTQGSNPGLPHCRQMLYHLSHQGSPRFRKDTKFNGWCPMREKRRQREVEGREPRGDRGRGWRCAGTGKPGGTWRRKRQESLLP